GWQHPYVNIFKHVKVEEWKRSAKVGDVTSYMDKTLKCSVFRIKGPVPANSYILVPKNPNHSLGLTGRYFYLLFRPTPGKYFMVHLDVAVQQEGQLVRISFSNMFKEFKSTATWLQFPFVCGAAKDSVYENTSRSARHLLGLAPTSVRWTCLMMDLRFTLSVYLNCHHSHLKSIKLCANMVVKNMFTSDLLLDPITFNEAKQRGLSSSQGTGPIPREMSFPVPKGSSWDDLYDHIFPSEGSKLPFDSIQKEDLKPKSASGQRSPITEEAHFAKISRAVQDRVSLRQQIRIPKLDDGGIHVYVHPEDALSMHGEESEDEVELLPDPILRLSRIIGFGGATSRCLQALWTRSGEAVVYPCHAIIVSMNILSREQRFFIGHT
uniref:WD repeat domain 90 n=1 Tax=Cyprinodon variegatus TaxID=28743 RepID=A0A3Q2G8V3_CYPVA